MNDSQEIRMCDCKVLDHFVDEPSVPVVFDDHTGEYQLTYESGGTTGAISLTYCFYCGGRLPESRRASLFTKIPREEEERLVALVKGISSFDDAKRAFGPPNETYDAGHREHIHEKDGNAPEIHISDVVVYTDLSDVANVRFFARPDGSVRPALYGKYIGEDPEAGDG